MIRVVLANIRAHRSRLIAVSLAVALSVAFMSAALILNSSLKATLQQSVGENFSKTDLVVSVDQYGESDLLPAFDEIDEELNGLPEVTAAFTPRSTDAMLRLGALEQYVSISQLAPDALRTSVVEKGRLPEGAGELAVSATVAEQFKLKLGERVELTSLQVYEPDDSGEVEQGEADPGVLDPRRVEATIVGLLEPSKNPVSAVSSEFIASEVGAEDIRSALAAVPLTPEGSASVNILFGQTMIALEAGIAVEPMRTIVAEEFAAHGMTVEVLTADEALQRVMIGLTGGADVLTFVIMTFVTIAVFVSGLVISNTFSVIVAQRARELALLRCLGASSQQVRRSVLLEALVMALVASSLGVIAAVALMLGLVQLSNASDLGATLGVFEMGWQAVLIPIVVGVLMTLLAAFGPAREATRVAPLAAMRPLEASGLAARAGRARLITGSLLFGGGFVALIAAAFLSRPELALPLALGGAVVSAAGVILLAIFVVPPVTGWIGRVFSHGVPGRLAALNSVRNPRRTSATATALLIGVTLVSTIYTGAEVSKATFAKGLDSKYPVDISVSADALSQDQLASLATIDGVETLVPMRHAQADAGAYGRWEIWGVAPADYAAVARAEARTIPEEGALVSDVPSAGSLPLVFGLGGPRGGMSTETDDDEVPPSAQSSPVKSLPVQRGGAPDMTAVVSPRQFDELMRAAVDAGTVADASAGAAEQTNGALLRLDDGLGGSEINVVRAEITELLPDAQVSGAALERAIFDQIITTLLLIVTGLLAVAIVIAVIGVSNTLSLSVIERTRENALMRALGLTRGQLRWTLANEALLLSAVAALAGIGLGVGYGYFGARSVLNSIGEVPIAIPWMALLLVLLLAAVAGLGASVLPSRRAARLSPIAGLAAE